MDLSRAHYHAQNGTVFVFDPVNRRAKPTKVQYVNPSPYTIDAGLNARVGGLIPNIDFQQTFIGAFYAAYDEVQRWSGNALQFDGNRLAKHAGADFIDGDMTFFVERVDKADNAQFREDFRATLAVNQFDGTQLSLVSSIRAVLTGLVNRQENGQ